MESLEQRCLLAGAATITEFMAKNDGFLEDGNGDTPDWIEIQNIGDAPLDLAGYRLTDDHNELSRWVFPQVIVDPGGLIVVFASGQETNDYQDAQGNYHTNFKLASDGEYLALVAPDGTILSEYGSGDANYAPQTSNVSYGIGHAVPSIDGQLGYMQTPTPGEVNVGNESVFMGVVGIAQVSVEAGFFDSPQVVEISSPTPGAEIYFTTDGSEPVGTNPAAQLYHEPLAVTTTMVLRTKATKADYIASDVHTATYLFLEDVIRQSNDQPGLPTRWQQPGTGYDADYEMDQDIVNDPAYRDEIIDGLSSIPTFSIVMDPEDLFSPDGLYIDTSRRGRASERPVSLEIIDPNGNLDLQIDAGLRNHGNRTRLFEVTLKQSLRLVFRGEYGAAKLEYPLFPDAPVDRFDNIVLHAAKILDDPQMVRNSFGRNTNLAMGNDEGHSTHVHLYLNGLYWGLYNPFERPDAKFASEYYGGSEADYDSILTDGTEVVDGDVSRYNAMWDLIRDGSETPEQLAEIERHVDLNDLIDLLLVNKYMAHDEAEMQAVGSRVGDPNFKFFAHDLDEGGMNSVRANKNLDGFMPPGVFRAMRNNPEIAMRFADRAHKHFFNGGALTAEVAMERWEGLYNNISSAAIAESARWGDTHWRTVFPREPYTPNGVLAAEGRFLRETFFPNRGQEVISQQRRLGLYPDIEAPTWNRFGGSVPLGFELTMAHANENGAILYTLDGTDPRQFGGDAWPDAQVYDGTAIPIGRDVVVKARVLSDGQWSALTETNFVIASEFPLRITEINYHPHGANSAPGVTELDGPSDQFEFVELLNTSDRPVNLQGVQLTRSDVFGDTQGIAFTFAAQELAGGERLVVVRDREAFQSRYGSAARIATGNDGQDGAQGEFSGRLADRGEQLTLVDANGQLIHQFSYKTRFGWPERADGLGSTLEVIDPLGDVASALNWRSSREFGGSPAAAGNADNDIEITEILANTNAADEDRIELFNGGTQDIDITHWYVSRTLDNLFNSQITVPTNIPASGYEVLRPSAFGIDLDGARGDEVVIVAADATGRPQYFVDHAEFDVAPRGTSLGRWPTSADPFLALEATTFGSPNADRATSDVIISEIHFHAIVPDGVEGVRDRDLEFIEVTNTTDGPVDMTGWQVAGQLAYTFPDDMILDAHESAVIMNYDPDRNSAARDRAARFKDVFGVAETVELLGRVTDPADRTSRDIIRNGGALVQLVRPDQPAVDDPSFVPFIVMDQVHYLPTSPWPEGNAGEGNSLTRTLRDNYGPFASSWHSATPSPGSVDFFHPATRTLRIVEINYHPIAATPDEQAAGYSIDDFQFIELVNRGSENIPLAGVRLVPVEVNGNSQGVEFYFIGSDVTELAPSQRVIVVANLDAFQSRYGDVTNVAGQWMGRLSGHSETLTLDAADDQIQQFTYHDSWYPSTDGAGSSLVFINVDAPRELWNQLEGWSPSGIVGGSPGEGTGRPGDFNGDGIFDRTDLVAAFFEGKYEDSEDGNSTFEDGDWNGDGDFTTADLVLVFTLGGFTSDPVGAMLPVHLIDAAFQKPMGLAEEIPLPLDQRAEYDGFGMRAVFDEEF